MALKEEIFNKNSTLFKVLDVNEVTEIGSVSKEVQSLNEEVSRNKLQLDALARNVNENQARNEAKFVDINTQLVEDRTDIGNLETTVQGLTTTTETNTTAIDDLNHSIESISDDIAEIEAKLESLENRISELEQAKISGQSSTVIGGVKYVINFLLGSQRGYRLGITFNTKGSVEYGVSYSASTEFGTAYLTLRFPAIYPVVFGYTGLPATLGLPTELSGNIVVSPEVTENVTGFVCFIAYLE